jgi:nudix-type nucleoside diphosphatase (YffH/AdpP family)
VHVLETQRVLDGPFLRVDSTKLTYELPGGARSTEQTRLNVDRGNAAAALLHEPSTNLLYFTRQFRFSTYAESDEPARDNGWLLEVIAGVVEPHERTEEAIRREILEETGFKSIEACELIGSFFLTPGASSERLFLFYVAVGGANREGGRAVSEGVELRGVSDEQIITETMTPQQFLDEVAAMRIKDAKTIVAAEYVRRNAGVFGLS